MDSQVKFLIVAAILAVVVYMVYSNCTIDCRKTLEGYNRTPFSSTGGVMKRTPSPYAFQGDGVTNNPHYQADPQDRLVPLTFGGLNPYKRVVNDLKPALTRDGLESCKRGELCDDSGSFVINDSKTRRDMAESGDMGWYRIMTNMGTSANKTYMGERKYEIESIQPDYSQPPLYSGDFHYNAVLGQ